MLNHKLNYLKEVEDNLIFLIFLSSEPHRILSDLQCKQSVSFEVYFTLSANHVRPSYLNILISNFV